MKKMKANGTRKKIAEPMMAMSPMTIPRVFFISSTSCRFSHQVSGMMMAVTSRKSTTLPAVDRP